MPGEKPTGRARLGPEEVWVQRATVVRIPGSRIPGEAGSGLSIEECLRRKTEGQGVYESPALRRPQEANQAEGRGPGYSGVARKPQAGPAPSLPSPCMFTVPGELGQNRFLGPTLKILIGWMRVEALKTVFLKHPPLQNSTYGVLLLHIYLHRFKMSLKGSTKTYRNCLWGELKVRCGRETFHLYPSVGWEFSLSCACIKIITLMNTIFKNVLR